MYIDLKTFLAILKNVPLWNIKDHEMNQMIHDKDQVFIDLFNDANYSVPPNKNGDHKINFTQLSLTLCVNDEDMRSFAIQVS